MYLVHPMYIRTRGYTEKPVTVEWTSNIKLMNGSFTVDNMVLDGNGITVGSTLR